MKQEEGDIEAALVRRIKKGEKGLFAVLFWRCRPVIKVAADDFVRAHPGLPGFLDSDELFQIGAMALWTRIVSGYKSRRNVRFVTYMCGALRNIFMDQLRGARRRKRNIPLQEIFRERSRLGIQVIADERSPYRLLAGTEDDQEQQLVFDRMPSLFGNLKERERVALSLKYGLFGNDQVQVAKIARILGITHCGVSNLVSRALVKLRAAIDREIAAEVRNTTIRRLLAPEPR